MVKSMVIGGITFSHVKQKGFGEKICSHSGEIFLNVDTWGVKLLELRTEAPLLIPSKVPWSLETWSNNKKLSNGFCGLETLIVSCSYCEGSGNQKWLSCVVLLSWVCSQGIKWDCSHLKVWLQLENPLSGWLTHMPGASCWQEALLPHHVDLSVGLIKCLHSMTGIRQSEWFPRKQGGSYTILCDITPEGTLHYVHDIWCYSMWKGTT